MKICFYTKTPIERLKYEQYTFNDVSILRKLGHNVILASSILDIPLDSDLIFSWWVSCSFWPSIISFISQIPLVIIAGGNEVNVFVAPVHRDLYGFYSYNLIKRICMRFAIHSCAYILPVSDFLRRSINLISPKSHAKNILVFNCVDPLQFHPQKLLPAMPRSSGSDFTIVTVSSLDEQSVAVKRLDLIIKAFIIAFSFDNSLKLVIIGRSGDATTDIKHALSASLPSSAYSILIDQTSSEVTRQLQAADLYCQISLVETFGLAAMEACFVGCPLLLSPSGAMPEIFHDVAYFLNDNFSVSDLCGTFIRAANRTIDFPSYSPSILHSRFSIEARSSRLRSILLSIE
jgi:glycosyltransferase involved in cell wall biosynthesis